MRRSAILFACTVFAFASACSAIIDSDAYVGGPTGGGAGGGTGGGTGLIDGGSGYPPVQFPQPNCMDGPGVEVPIDFPITSLYFPSPSDADTMPGYELDGVRDACGINDFEVADVGTIDNGFAFYRPFLDAAVGPVGGTDFNASVSNAIASGSVTYSLTLSGWNLGDDDCVAVSFVSGVASSPVVASGVVLGGALFVVFPEVPLALPVAGGTPLLRLQPALVFFDMNGGTGQVGGMIDRGGTAPYSTPIASASPSGTMLRFTHDVATSTAFPATEQELDQFLTAATDMVLPGTNTCAATGVGFTFFASSTIPVTP